MKNTILLVYLTEDWNCWWKGTCRSFSSSPLRSSVSMPEVEEQSRINDWNDG
jgi:hypothetical protein